MSDPDEGVAADGTIRTGARRDRVPPMFEPVLREAVESLRHTGASLYLYGSVATGTARHGVSDVDLLSIGLADAVELGGRLSVLFADSCRGVEIAAAEAEDFDGHSDAAYGNRVFVRHYCVHLAGPDRATGMPAFPADLHAARGFNGDLDRHLNRWRTALSSGAYPAHVIGTRVARKTLLAVAGMVSAHDHTWTTDRTAAALRWSEIEPGLATGLAQLEAWVAETRRPTPREVGAMVDDSGLVPAIVERFSTLIGLWDGHRDAG